MASERRKGILILENAGEGVEGGKERGRMIVIGRRQAGLAFFSFVFVFGTAQQ